MQARPPLWPIAGLHLLEQCVLHPAAVLIIYRYTIQGLGHSGLAMFAGVAEMIARAMVGFWFVPLWGYFAACIASPVAWLFACFFLIPAYFVVFRKLQKEKQQEAAAKVQ